ncbi:MAG: amino acid adenylation domain-containing protein [Blastocatellia bacterium]
MAEELFVLPVSFAQQRLWFLEQLEPGTPAYNMPAAVRLTGNLDVATLERSFTEIVRRHEVLRTTFAEVEGEPVQVVAPGLELRLRLVNLSDVPHARRAAEIEQIAIEEARRPFDFSKGPLLRVSLLRTSHRDHVLLLTMHHIVSDGWSFAVLIREMMTLYEAYSMGKSSPLEELPIQYADYTLWQREWLQGKSLEAQLEYWKLQLGGKPPILELNLDSPRPQTPAFSGAREQTVLPETLVGDLRDLGRRNGATLFMVLLAAFKLVLHRHTGQTDIVVGSPIAGRNRPGLNGLIGFFVNTLILRTDVSGKPTFTELLRRVRESALGAFANQDLPFEKIVEELQPERGETSTPFFRMMFNHLNIENVRIETPGLAVEVLPPPEPASKFDLTLYAREAKDKLQFELVYNAEILRKAHMAELLEQLVSLLGQLAANPEKSIDEYSLITVAARSRLPNPSEPIMARWTRSIVEQFAKQAKQRPGHPALLDKDGSCSYRELDLLSNQLAHFLIAGGIRRGDVVAVYGHRSSPIVWAMLAALKAGAVFVILDPSHPSSRSIKCLELAKPKGWLQIKAAGRLPDEFEQFLTSSSISCRLELPHCASAMKTNPLADYSADDSEIEIGPKDAAYVAFTSGSTGRPKGLLGTHAPLSHFLEWHCNQFGLGPDERFSMLSGLSHDPLLRDVFAPLWLGATLCIPDPESIAEPGWLADWMKQQRISVAHLTPGMAQMIAIGGGALNGEGGALDSLRHAFVGADVLTGSTIASLRRIAPSAACVNFYGTTETPQAAGFYVVSDREQNNPAFLQRLIPIGRGIADVQLLVLNASRKPAGIGEVGEIFVRTPYLSSGYLNDPELTSERFIVNQFTGASEDLLYQTGDAGRYSIEGEVEFLGRSDQQVKIRGFRVELKEVEAALSEYPAVQHAIVTASEAEPTDRRLIAYIVVKDQPIDADRLRRFLKQRLPDYMCPSLFISVPAIPLTPNGKVDYSALSDPDSMQEHEGVYDAPRTPFEEVLAAIWQEVLGIEQVGVHHNFFELGGHSLLAARLIARVREAFQMDLPLRALFNAPTIAALGAEITERKTGHHHHEFVSALPAITPDPQERYSPFPLTDIQQAYWIGRLGSIEMGNVASHRYLEAETSGLDLTRFSQAWLALIDRHDMLRAIVLPDGRQQILESVPRYEIAVTDARGFDPTDISGHLERTRHEMSHQMLATDRWPLFEIRATRLDDERLRLHFSFDYLIADALSFQILFQELLQLYEKPNAAGAPLELSFRDYVLAEAALKDSDLFRRSQQYWFERLATLPAAPELPLARTPASLSRPRFVRRSRELDKESWARVKERATRAGLTPSGILMSAFAEILAAWSKGPRFTVVLTLFNRLPIHAEVNRVVGDFTSTTLLEIDSSQPTFEDRARSIQQQLWDDFDHRFISGVEVLRELGRRHGVPMRAALPVVFTSILTPAGATGTVSAQPALGEIVFAVSQTPQVWLDHQAYERDSVLVLNWDAVEDLFPPGMLDCMFESYCLLLRRLADEEAVWHEKQREITPSAQLERFAGVNATDKPLPAKLLHSLFAEQVAVRSGEPAVITADLVLSYEELDHRSDYLVRGLRDLGVRPNTLVGVVMNKGWEQVVAVLAILKSGAAYLPIDASLPLDRIRYLLENGEVRTAITQPSLIDKLEWPAGIHRLSVEAHLPASVDTEPPVPPQALEDLAYVIYTSGSTGLPKGVMIDHKGAVNTVLDMNLRFAVGPEDRVLAISSLSFDLSVYDIFGPLAAGGAIVIPDAHALRDPEHWAELMSRARVTIWNSVPALMEMLASYVTGKGEQLPESLRLVLMSGDWIPVSLPDQIRDVGPDIQIVALGGATEASIWSILYPIEQIKPDWKSIPYGQPMLNQKFYVLSEWLEPRPVWVPGQLYIGGIGLAKGYWRNEQKTSASFIIHPSTGERIYQTGDLGRYLPDGNIEFLGREDFQVKIQGYRIELGEIEAALLEFPSVGVAVVTAAGELRGHKRLVGYLVARPGQALDIAEVQRSLRKKLPEYMVPSDLVIIDKLPLTSNGKVDRKALPVPGQLRSLEKSFEPPRTTVENMIAAIYSRMLRVEKVGLNDDFFMLGGNSIQAILLASDVRQSFQIDLPLRRFFENPTVGGLAETILHLQVEQTESGEMAQMLSALEELSEPEAQAMIAQEMLANQPGPSRR